MNVLLVDHLACPRCGPTFGLVLLAREVRSRRVHRGELGCPNCRDAFPVEGGVADLRPPPRTPLPPETAPPTAERAEGGGLADHALRLAAALGMAGASDGRGGLCVVSDGWRDAAVALARLLPEIEVVALGRHAQVATGAEPVADRSTGEVSRMATGSSLPFRDGSARGVALAGRDWEDLWREAVRVTAWGGRIAVTDAPRNARTALEDAGLTTILDGDGWLVAHKGSRQDGKRRTSG